MNTQEKSPTPPDNPLLRKYCSCSGGKLDTTDWLSNYSYIDNEAIPRIVEVRFKNTRKEFYKNPNMLRLRSGNKVIVESPTGYDLGTVSLTSDLVNLQLKKRGIDPNKTELPNVIRMANEKDLAIYQEAKDLEMPTLIKTREIIKDLNLEMKLNDVEYQADKRKATFFYTAEGRVDFRELIKLLAKTFKIKVEMRQIGIRQEAGRVGGIGDCGRELCCSSWLTEFSSVPTIAAKQQNLYLNPSKLSGQCGRLKCCLNYELDTYMEAYQNFPPEDIVIETKEGKASVFKFDLLKGLIWFNHENNKDLPPFPLSIKDVNMILDMNERGILPDSFDMYVVKDKQEKRKKNSSF